MANAATRQIIVLGYSEAMMFLRRADASVVSAVISIFGQGEFGVEAPWTAHRLDLQFDDCDVPDEADPLAAARWRIRQREAAEIGRNLRPPTLEHARQIVEFAAGLSADGGALLCQCMAGISRSPAAAILCYSTWLGAGFEPEAVGRVLGARPGAVPHRGLVRFGDEVLGRGGRLLSALEQAQGNW